MMTNLLFVDQSFPFAATQAMIHVSKSLLVRPEKDGGYWQHKKKQPKFPSVLVRDQPV